MAAFARVEHRETGEVQHVEGEDRAELDRRYPSSRFRRRFLPRLPGELERVERGAIASDDEARAERVNGEHCAALGRHAIDTARAAKAIEARLMLSGVELRGYVTAEAEATGQDPLELARIIIGQADQAVANEVERVLKRRAIRGI